MAQLNDDDLSFEEVKTDMLISDFDEAFRSISDNPFSECGLKHNLDIKKDE